MSHSYWQRGVRCTPERSGRTGTSEQVTDALKLLNLRLPVTPEDITRQYRVLAKAWHPDMNPGDSSATARFQHLQSAYELLGGTDASALAREVAKPLMYEKEDSARSLVIDGEMGISVSFSVMVSEKYAADWIYACNLGKDGRAYLAGYSGKVVALSPNGLPERIYDVGTIPRQIVDAGEHLYILTGTRLYVLARDRLEAVVDVFDTADIIVADRGFALLESKALHWFSPDGSRLGTVRTKDPIRRVYSGVAGLVIETRQHRAVIGNAPAWWAS